MWWREQVCIRCSVSGQQESEQLEKENDTLVNVVK